MSNVIRILCDKELKGHNEDCELRWYRVKTSLEEDVFFVEGGNEYGLQRHAADAEDCI